MIMDITSIQNIVPAGILTALGAGLGWMFSSWFSVRQFKSEENFRIIETLHSQINSLEDRVTKKDGSIDTLLKERQQLSEQVLKATLRLAESSVPPVEVLKELIRGDPGLSWAKVRTKEGLFINIDVSPMYARLFLGGPPETYHGLQDKDIWPADVAKAFNENDEMVYTSQTGEFVEEDVYSPLTGAKGVFKGRKYSIRLSDGLDYIVGTGEFEAEDGS